MLHEERSRDVICTVGRMNWNALYSVYRTRSPAITTGASCFQEELDSLWEIRYRNAVIAEEASLREEFAGWILPALCTGSAFGTCEHDCSSREY